MADDPSPAVLAQVAYEQAHPTEFGCTGLVSFTIIGIFIITFALSLRFWSRKLAKIPLKADDYLLLLALVLTIGAQAMAISNIRNAHWCRHQSTLTHADFALGGKQWYAWGLMYTTSYPIARISLALLYRRIFIQQWVRWTCWFLVFCYICYSVGSFFADIFQFNPIASGWDLDVKRTHTIDIRALYLANSGFNIGTDVILLILPLAAIWNIKLSFWRKFGLGLIFSLGCLTVIASVFRLALYFTYNALDPNYALAPVQWWTHAEMDLGILCPCFVTMQPLLRHGFVYISSQLSPRNRSRMERATGVSTSLPLPPKINGEGHPSSHTLTLSEKQSRERSLRSKPSRMEEGREWYDMEDLSHPMPTQDAAEKKDVDADGMHVDQEAALASLDPRTNTTSNRAHVERGPGGNTPEAGIGIAKEFEVSK